MSHVRSRPYPLLLALLLIASAPAALSAAGKARQELVDGQVTIRLPADWKRLDAAAVGARLGNAQPARAFGTASGSHNVAVDFPRTALAPPDVDTLCSQVGAQIEAAGFTFLGATRSKLGGHGFCVIDFRRELAGGALRITRAVTSFEARYLAVTFTVGVQDERAWERQLRGLLDSIKLTASKRGGPCEAGAAQKCVDDEHHAVCAAGKWRWTSCKKACKEHATVGCRYNEGSHTGLCTCRQ